MLLLWVLFLGSCTLLLSLTPTPTPTLVGASCPVKPNITGLCMCDTWQIKCTNLGDHRQFPDLFASNDNRIYSNITIRKSRIRTLQENAIGAIRTREIFLIGIGIEVIQDRAFAGQTDALEALYLSDNRIRIIQRGAFSNLARLIRLKLDNNRIVQLEKGLFDGLSSLKNLYLHGNVLRALYSRTFPAGLETLTLYKNKLSQIDSNVFDQANLTLLNLRENGFSVLPTTLFHELPSLTDLDLSWNNLTSIERDLFAKSARLRHLDLAINRIDVIHPMAFSSVVNLDFLDLSDNRLDSIPGPLFGNLSHLRSLFLSSNLLTKLPDQMSSGMRNLRTLYLYSNKLNSIGQTHLRDLVHLEDLRLDHNRISNIELGALDRLGRLKRLDLSDNLLTNLFDDPFRSSVNIEWIDLSYNYLDEIPDTYFRRLDRIQFLDLSNNRIRNISADGFISQSGMKYLNLSNNWLQNLHPGTFRSNGNVTFLSLSSNPLLSLDTNAFEGLASLDSLIMNNTCLTDLPNNLFRDATRIRRIDLENGRIRSIRNETFSGLGELLYLDLSGNAISRVESGSFSSPKIQTLKLAHNDIDIYGLRAATSLFSPTVTLLDIAYNNVTALTGITRRLFDEIDNVFFAGNPFACDCESDTFWIRSLHSLRDPDMVVCSSPPSRVRAKVVCFEADCENVTYSSYPFEDNCVRSAAGAAGAAGTAAGGRRQWPDVCDMSRYTASTTTTTARITTLRLAGVRISVYARALLVRGTPTVLVTWHATDELRKLCSGYAISAETIGSGRPASVFVMDPASGNYSLNDVDPDAEVRTCVRAVFGARDGGGVPDVADCASVRTPASTSASASTENDLTLIIVLGIVSVVSVVVVILIVVGVCLRRQRKRTGPKEVGKKTSNTSLSTSPQAWVQAPDVTLVGDRSDVTRRASVNDSGEGGDGHVTEMTDIWMDDDGEINFGADYWEEGHVTGLSQSLPAIDLQKDKAKRKNSAPAASAKRSNSTLASAGKWAASFKSRASDGGAPIGEQMAEQTMLSLNIFDCKNGSRLDNKHTGFGK